MKIHISVAAEVILQSQQPNMAEFCFFLLIYQETLGKYTIFYSMWKFTVCYQLANGATFQLSSSYDYAMQLL